MKTNLNNFKNSEKLEKEGIWFNTSDEIGFLVRRFGGMNTPEMRKAVAKHFKPYSYQIQNGTLDPIKEREILTKIFIDACVIDWKGVEIDDVKESYSPDKCLKIFMEYPDLCDSLRAYAEDTKNYREDLGNS